MPTRSAKSAAGAKIQKALAESDHDTDMDGYFDDTPNISDEDEDEAYTTEKTASTSRKSTSRDGPPAKKAKASNSSQKLSVAGKASRRKSLSVLVTMPLDILFEVFGHLAPKDLLSLSKTTKTLRATLLNQSAKSVWITSRSREGAPNPPTDMSEPQWAALIFGSTCMSCTSINIHTIDFLIRRRVCTNCKKTNLFVRHRIRKEFEGIDESILDYISPTNVGGWAHGHASTSQFYWKFDIENMLYTLAKYEANVRSRKKGAKQALDDFKARRLEIVRQTREDERIYLDWVSSAARTRQLDIHEAQEKRKEEIIRRFMELGYAREDVISGNHTFWDGSRKTGEVTKRVWPRLRTLMEPRIMQNKQSRQELEDRAIRLSRRQILDRLFKEYKMTVPPAQWKYFPTTAILGGLQPFRDIIEADASTVVTEAELRPSMENISEILTAAKDALKTRLIERAVASYRSPPNGNSALFEGTAQLEPLQIFELATTVFECGSCHKSMYGWDEITSHFCSAGDTGIRDLGNVFYGSTIVYNAEYPYEFSFNSKATSAVRTAIKTAGLDPASATAAEMDANDLRFTCVKCDSSSSFHYGSSRKNRAYTWRGLVDHIGTHHDQHLSVALLAHIGIHHDQHDLPIALLSPETTTAVKLQEPSLTRGPSSKWASTRCSAYLTNPSNFDQVKKHLQDVHHIATPQEGVDLIYLPRKRMENEVKYTTTQPIQQSTPQVGSKANGIFKWPVKCRHCQSSGSVSQGARLFDLDGVRSHIKAKHNVNAAAKDVDYLVVAKADIPQSWKVKFRPAPDDLPPP